MKLVVGLGNPGAEYERTRHNIGWRVLETFNVDFSLEKKFKAVVAKEGDLIYCLPQTFMNNSGQAVRAVVDYYEIDLADIVVIYDDKDLPFGTIRLRSTGSSAGHNGVQSIIDHLGTTDFTRVRIGIAAHYPIKDTSDFVLRKFSSAEEEQMPELLAAATDAVETAIAGIDKTSHQDFSIPLEPKDD